MHKTGYAVDRDALVRQHLPLVKRVAARLMVKLPASVQLDDLVQVGLLGLLEAAEQYDPAQPAQFETFAGNRIRGAMLDELRAMDWLPRSARRAMREIEAAVHALEQRLKRPPTEAELARAMNLSIDAYQEKLFEAAGHQLLHLEDLGTPEQDFLETHTRGTDATGDPLAVLADGHFREALVAAIATLPEREQLVMSLYYEQELNLKEIGLVLEVSESRVCQLHAQAVARLRAKMKDWLNDEKD